MTKLIELTEKNLPIKLDLHYASTKNVCGVKLYSQAQCFLHEEAFEKFKKAIEIAAKHNLRFKIFDGYRPMKVQKFMFEKFSNNDSGFEFVSNPKTGSTPHCRGVAIDLTLIDENDNELEMGSDFDEFSELAFHNCDKISATAKKNRELLFDIMKEAGWDFYSKEWWHYQLFNARSFEVIEDYQNLSAV